MRRHLTIAFAVTLSVGAALTGTPLQSEGTSAPAIEPLGPGGLDTSPVIASSCPTFHWSLAGPPNAELGGLELAVMLVEEVQGELVARPARRFQLSAGARLMTPNLDECLEPGRRYAWWIRPIFARDPVGGRDDSQSVVWSQLRFFEVARAPDLREIETALSLLASYRASRAAEAGEPEASAAAESLAGVDSTRSAVRRPSAGLVVGADRVGLRGRVPDTGVTIGILGETPSPEPGSTGVVGEASAPSGATIGVAGQVASPVGVAGLFDNLAGGKLLSGQVSGVEKFAVDGEGEVTATSFAGDGSDLTGVAASSLGGVSSDSFLRSDESDTFSGTSLELSFGSRLVLPTGGSPGAPPLVVDNVGFRSSAGSLAVSLSGTDRMSLSSVGKLSVLGTIGTGTLTPKTYNSIGAGTKSHVDVVDGSDLYVSDDLEIDGVLFADDDAYLTQDASVGHDLSVGSSLASDDDRISFDAGQEFLLWDESPGEFDLSDDLSVAGALRATGGGTFDGDLRVGQSSTSDDDTIFFDGGDHFLRWDDFPGEFDLNGNLNVSGSELVGDDLWVGFNSSTDDDLVLFDAASEFLRWDENPGEFDLSDDLNVDGDLTVAGTAAVVDLETVDGVVGVSVSEADCSNPVGAGCPTSFSSFEAPYTVAAAPGIPSPSGPISGRIDNPGAVWIQNALEIGSLLYARLIASAQQAGASTAADLKIGSNNKLAFFIDTNSNSGGNERFEWWTDTNYATDQPELHKLAELLQDGTLRLKKTLEINHSFDLAESFLALDELSPGDLVSIDPRRRSAVSRTARAGDRRVIGVVSTQPGLHLGGPLQSLESLEEVWGAEVSSTFLAEEQRLRESLIAADGEIRRLVDSGPDAPAVDRELRQRALELFYQKHFAPIALAGRVPVNVDADLGRIAPGDLLTSSPIPGVAMRAPNSPTPGTVIGKALEPLDSGQGQILVLVLQK